MLISTEIGSIANFVGEEKAVELVGKAGFDAWDFSMFDMCRIDWGTGLPLEEKNPLNGSEYLAFAKKILDSGENNDEFIKQILESITISKDNIITVKINLLPFKWKFALSSVVTAAGSSFCPKTEQYIVNVSDNKGENAQRDHSTTDAPTSVNNPFSSS